MNHKWSPEKEWWMDLLKSLVSFVLVAFFTYIVIDRYTEQRSKLRVQDDAVFQVRVEALREFRRATMAYEVAALSAYVDLYQWQTMKKTATMLRYEQEAWSAWKAALEEVRFRQSDDPIVKDAVDSLTEAVNARHLIYDDFVNLHLDSKGLIPIYPGFRRTEFDHLSQEIATYRAQIIDRLETLILRQPRSK
jgi:hypothetical protein